MNKKEKDQFKEEKKKIIKKGLNKLGQNWGKIVGNWRKIMILG